MKNEYILANSQNGLGLGFALFFERSKVKDQLTDQESSDRIGVILCSKLSAIIFLVCGWLDKLMLITTNLQF